MTTGNEPAWKGKLKPFYEVWYWKLNLPESGKAAWLRLTLLQSKDKKVAEVWGIFFEGCGSDVTHTAAKERFPIGNFSFDGQRVRIADSYFGNGETAGLIRSSEAEIAWDLRFRPEASAFFHVPGWVSALKINRSTVLTPYPRLLFEGSLTVNGKRHLVADSPGMQGHIYGSKQAEEWAWAHVCSTDSNEPFVLELLTARLKLGGFLKTPPISVMLLEYRGKRYELKSLIDSRSIVSGGTLEEWRFSGSCQGIRAQGVIRTRIQDFAGVRYEDTDGSFLYCHNSKISLIQVHISRDDFEDGFTITSRSCAFERVTRAPDARVRFIL